MSPQRIQLRRTKGWRKPEGAVVVSRPSGWGNPFRPGEPYRFVDGAGRLRVGVVGDRTSAARLFTSYLAVRIDMHEQVRTELGGRDLACWCPLDAECHADVLLRIANGSEVHA